MIRSPLIAVFLLVATPCVAADAPTAPAAATTPPAVPLPVQAAPAPGALPAMRFFSSVASEELLAALKAEPALSALDTELPGSPLSLIVTHTLRPTAGGQAAGLLSAVLSGGTLGLIPIVTNDRLVVRYEVMLNGKTVTTHTFERTATRAQNLWTAGNDGYGGLGKAGMEWVRSTATDVAGKLAADPALSAVRDEIAFYFPPPPAPVAAPAPQAPPPPATSAH